MFLCASLAWSRFVPLTTVCDQLMPGRRGNQKTGSNDGRTDRFTLRLHRTPAKHTNNTEELDGISMETKKANKPNKPGNQTKS